MHLVARGVAAHGTIPARALVVPHGKEGASVAHRKVRLPLGFGGVGIGVQLEWRAESHSAVGRANVVNVAGVAAVFLRIDEANHVVVGSRLTPAHVSPVTAAIHAAEVARSATAGTDEGGPGVGVGPSGAAVSGAIHQVGSGGPAAGKTAIAAVFVHAGDIHVARDLVAGDLDVADERSTAAYVDWAAPSRTAVSGAHNEDVRVGKIKVVPRNIHVPEEGRTRVVVGIAGLAVGRALVESAEMGPAIRVRRVGGLIPAETLAATERIEQDVVPGSSWLIVQKNRVTKGTGEGALTGLTGWSVVGTGDAGKGVAAVCGGGCA